VAVFQSNARLQQASGAAASTLLKIMVDASAPASTRVRAADSVLDRAKQSIEIEDIEVRVAALEQAARNGEADRRVLRRPDAKCTTAPSPAGTIPSIPVPARYA
jgi:hypothetical protein